MPRANTTAPTNALRVKGCIVDDAARFVPYPGRRGRWIGWEKVEKEADAEWRIDGAAGRDPEHPELHTSDLFLKGPPIFLRRIEETVSVAPALADHLRRAIRDGDLEELP